MAASTTPTTSSRSRRALLAGALGGIGAWAAGAVARVSPVRGANGDPITVGNSFTGTGTTSISNNTTGSVVLWGSSNSGIAVYGSSGSSIGVVGGSASSNGVFGDSSAADQAGVVARSFGGSSGLLGVSGTSLPDAKPKTGVYGYANQDSGSRGVWGFSGRGAGVYGQANKAGFALRANGRIRADKVSGVATILAGSTSVTVSPNVNVTSGSFVLLTPRANIGSRGLWYTVQASADTFKIRMSSSRSSNTKVAWLLLG